MTITVPSRRPRETPVPPAGDWNATLKSLVPQDDIWTGTWTFRANDKNWTHKQEYDETGVQTLLVDLGFAGQDVEEDDLAGTKASVTVRTYGGRTSAKIAKVRPVTD